ncbi:MAG: SAM-dependent methyltransferase [Pseudomonadota bacterium]
MRPLLERLRARIAATGPISLADYMALALGDPAAGYYRTRDPLGRSGDFTTAPEISQMFGELIGLWLADRLARHEGARPRLVELGPGRGTLMADALRAAGPLQTLPLSLVETSRPLRAAQASRLPQAVWHETLEAVPDEPLLLVANEFLDALPVRQYLADDRGWREVQVGLAGAGLGFGLSGRIPRAGLQPAPGDWAEESPAAEGIVASLAARIAHRGGAALIIDYGYREADRPAGPTLQAIKDHARADPLAAPGEADLTWLIDFDRLAAVARDAVDEPHAIAVHVTTQGAFLAQLGIGLRAAALARARPEEAGAIADALERLTSETAMGTRFKVMAITPAGPPPPGFVEEPKPEDDTP